MQQIESDYQIVWLVRRLFRALAQKSGENLQDLGITVADRAVMEFLHPNEKLSVPEIAERYQVSRQHVQVTVNRLLDTGLVETEVNQRHKRSSLMVLTRKGKSVFQKVKKRDSKALKELFSSVSENDKRVTRKTLQALLTELK